MTSATVPSEGSAEALWVAHAEVWMERLDLVEALRSRPSTPADLQRLTELKARLHELDAALPRFFKLAPSNR